MRSPKGLLKRSNSGRFAGWYGPSAFAVGRRLLADTHRGFTLIELLVVLGIIAILAALVAPNVFQHLGTAKDTSARSQIELFGAALDAYRLDNGRYPTAEQGLQALWTEPQVDPRPTSWHGPYLRKPAPLDPWGIPYVYRSPGEVTQLGYELVSFGADGKAGGEGEAADITSWENKR